MVVLFHDTNSARSYTYQQLRNSAVGFGAALRSAWNWQKGNVLAVFSQNDVDYPAVILGCLWAGGVVTTASPSYTKYELANQLKDCDAKAIITTPPFLDTALGAAREAGIPQSKIILMGNLVADSRFRHFHSMASPKNLQDRTKLIRPFSVDQNDLSFLVYSSGTSGKPKGVMLTHKNIVANILMSATVQEGNLSCGNGETGSGDRTVGFVPFFHIYGKQDAPLGTDDTKHNCL